MICELRPLYQSIRSFLDGAETYIEFIYRHLPNIRLHVYVDKETVVEFILFPSDLYLLEKSK